MSNQPAEFLEKAKIAIHKGDQKAAKSLLNQILQRDIKHPEAWQLLYRNFGSEEPFETFQRQYTKKNFPKKINDLNDQKEPSVRRVSLGRMRDRPARGSKPEREPNADSQPSKSEKKRGLISRISSIFRRKPKSQIKPITPDRPVEPSPPVKTEKGPIRLSSLKNTPPTPSLREELSIVPPTPTISAPPLAFTRETQTLPTDERIRVLVVDDIAQTRENLIKLLSLQPSVEVIGGARTGGEGVSMALERDPHVVLMDINMPDMDGLEATRLLRSKIPFAQVVILTVQDDPSYMREAIVAGARDFLVKPPMVEELFSAVQRAYIIAREEKARIPPPIPPEYAGISDPATKRRESRRIISIYSPKGGVGATTLASNLAVALQSDNTPVIIVDGCMQFGGISIAFNERSKHSVLDLTPRVAHLDPEVVGGVVITHASSTVRILAAPEKAIDAEEVDPTQLGALLKYLVSIFSYVIVDTSSDLTAHTLSVLDASDLVLLVTSQDIPSLDRMRRFLDLAPAIGLNKERFRLVLSRYSERINITPDRISQNFKQDIFAVIPNDYGVIMPSINQGSPFWLDKKLKGRPIYKSVSDLAKMIVNEADEVAA